MDFEQASQKALSFREERDWAQFHNPKDLAISISLEAAELLELFQWTGTDLEASDRRDQMADELADVLIYSVYLADRLGLNPGDIMASKIEKNEAKYPVDKSRGNARKYDQL